MRYKIRQLTPDDYEPLIELWIKCGLSHRPKGRDSKEAISVEMARKETGFIGMFDRGLMMGFILVTSDGRKGWINRLAIDPKYQRQGLAMILVEKAETFLHDLGIKVIAALIEGDNQASFATFKKAGYIYHDDIVYYSKRSSAID